MELTDALVREIGKLARLALSDDEAAAARGHLAAMLEYVATLQELDVDAVELTGHPLGAQLPLCDDAPGECLDRATLLEGAPATDGEHFLVPKVIDQG